MLINAAENYAQGGLDAPVTYRARDSIVANIPSQQVTLYGDAFVSFEGIELTADHIEIDLVLKEVLATFSLDSAGNPVGKPVFTSDGEESQCDYVKYNFETKKGYIREVRAQQDEGYIHMAESKIHPNEEIHLKNGKFTTCDKENPHYHFKLTRAIIVPDERIVTGPVYMKIFKVPTPLAAPFAFFPNSDSKKHGIIIPEFANSSTYGFGLQDLGYYIPLGDSWETQFNTTIYTTGSFGVGNTTNYLKRYKYNGGFSGKYERFQGYFFDSTSNANKVSISWIHNQDPKAHPSIRFSANVNFKSDNNGKTSLETFNKEVFTNQFNSSIKLSKSWRTKALRGSASLNTSLQQNSVGKSYSINLPSFNFQVSQFSLGDLNRKKIGKNWTDEIKVRYSMDAANFINAPDSIFNFQQLNQVGNYARNGVKQQLTVNSNLKLAGGRFTFTPAVNYSELWNFQYETHAFNPIDSIIDTTAVRGFGTARNMDFSGSLTSGFYGVYRIKGKHKTRFKHTTNQTLTGTYRPDISSYQEIPTLTDTVYISPFYQSQYKEGGRGSSALLSWTLNNTLKMKTKDMKDTINERDKALDLINGLSWSGNYDFIKDSMQLSDQRFAFRTANFLKIFTFQSDATLTPYAFDSLNRISKDYAWKNNQRLGTITSARLIVNANFTSKQGRKKQKELAEKTADNADATTSATVPGKVNFDIPWQLNLSYNLNYNFLRNKALSSDPDYKVIQTLVLNGDFSINQKWKLRGSMSLDLQQFNPDYQDQTSVHKYERLISTYDFEIWRDLHCWEAVLQFRQIGPVQKEADGSWGSGQFAAWKSTNWTFMFRVNIKASMFQAIKLQYNQPPFIF